MIKLWNPPQTKDARIGILFDDQIAARIGFARISRHQPIHFNPCKAVQLENWNWERSARRTILQGHPPRLKVGKQCHGHCKFKLISIGSFMVCQIRQPSRLLCHQPPENSPQLPENSRHLTNLFLWSLGYANFKMVSESKDSSKSILTRRWVLSSSTTISSSTLWTILPPSKSSLSSCSLDNNSPTHPI